MRDTAFRRFVAAFAWRAIQFLEKLVKRTCMHGASGVDTVEF